MDGMIKETMNKIESTTTVNITDKFKINSKMANKTNNINSNPNGGDMGRKQTITRLYTRYSTTKTITAPTTTPNGYAVTFDTNGGTITEELTTNSNNKI